MKILTIVICTYNREDVLGICLESLTKQTAAKDTFDVIIVDNNSTDKSAEIAKKYVNENSNFKYVMETNQGLSYSRNRGYIESDSMYVGYVDDDAKVREDFVENALKVAEDIKPDIFGGPIYPYYLNEKPEWFKDKYGEYSVYEETGFITGGKYLSGSNVFFKKELLEEYGGFNVDLGMKGKALGYHEETAIQNKAFEDKKKVYYSLDIVGYHIVAEVKQNVLFFIYSGYKSGLEGTKVWSIRPSVEEVFNLIKKYDGLMRKFYEAMFNRDSKKYPHVENYVIEELGQHLFDLGYLTSAMIDDDVFSNELFIDFLIRDRNFNLNEFLDLYEKLTNISTRNIVMIRKPLGFKETYQYVFRIVALNKTMQKILKFFRLIK